jgi:(E)-4-hydroxy-3-methylbut-2-enyl-diphosphate synthase
LFTWADSLPSFSLPGNLKQLYNYPTWQKLTNKTLCHPVFTLQEYIDATDRTSALNLVRIKNADLETEAFGLIPLDNTLVFVLETDAIHGMADQREFFLKLEEMELNVPVIVKRSYNFENQESRDKNQDTD